MVPQNLRLTRSEALIVKTDLRTSLSSLDSLPLLYSHETAWIEYVRTNDSAARETNAQQEA